MNIYHQVNLLGQLHQLAHKVLLALVCLANQLGQWVLLVLSCQWALLVRLRQLGQLALSRQWGQLGL